ncbi:hypothetical protein KO361_03150 [Candidatus Woesearchaeota archaeon]|jgi:hypothetical protein|nr:hypothetical protein [Candidatus Woesearchaeota archaeon]
MEVKEFIIELIKVDKVYNDMIDNLMGVLDDQYLDKMLPEYGESLENKIMDFVGIPKERAYKELDKIDGYGYCRDLISEEYWDLRDSGKYKEAYRLLIDEAKEMKENLVKEKKYNGE